MVTHDKEDNDVNALAVDRLVTSEISPLAAAVLAKFHGQVHCTNSIDGIYDADDYIDGDHDYLLFLIF